MSKSQMFEVSVRRLNGHECATRRGRCMSKLIVQAARAVGIGRRYNEVVSHDAFGVVTLGAASGDGNGTMLERVHVTLEQPEGVELWEALQECEELSTNDHTVFCIPIDPDCYGSCSAAQARACAEAVEAAINARFPDVETRFVPETMSFGNRSHGDPDLIERVEQYRDARWVDIINAV